MVKGNLGDSVRSRIDAIVGRQEARDNAEFAKTFDARRKAEPVKVPEVRKNNAEPMKTLDVAKVKQVGEKKPKLPVILFSVLGVVIVGLVIAILVVVKPWDAGGDSSDEVADSADLVTVIDLIGPAADASQEIINNVENNPDYSKEDAVLDFEKLMSNSAGMGKVYVAFYYSGFIYDNFNDSNRAVEILESVKELVDDDNKAGYDAFLNRYKEDGNGE